MATGAGPTAVPEAAVRVAVTDLVQASADDDADVFHLTWWSERMLDWAMAHPAFKTQLFRFVDVFPACRSDAEVMRHLDEYFDGVDIPRALDVGLDAADRVPFGKRITASVARRNILKMAGQFIAGADPDDALPRLRTLWDAGEAFTVDLLGEKTVTAGEADRYAGRVVEMIDRLASGTASWPGRAHLESDPWGTLPRVNVSVKPTALAPRFAALTREHGLAEALDRLEPVMERARDAGATVHFDMEHYGVKDLTLDLLRAVGERWPDGPALGAVIQAYLRDAQRDLSDLIAWSGEALATPLQVRLVKGAYWDSETVEAAAHGWTSPVWQEKGATDANYERCVDLLVDAARDGRVRPAVASHNLRSLAYAIAAGRCAGLDDDALEFQLLYGMAEPVHAALRGAGRRVRVYSPVGELVPGMAYLVRRLLENTSNESFVRLRFAEHADLDALVQPPSWDGSETEPRVASRSGSGRQAAGPGPFANEPPAEFRQRGRRAAFAAAVVGAPGALGFEVPAVIDGRQVATGTTITSHDPGDTGTVVCTSSSCTADDADRAVAAVAAAQAEWGARPAAQRAGVLFRAAAVMRDRRDSLAALEVFEAGKPWAEADADVCEAIDFLEYYGREALRLDRGGAVLDVPGETNVYRYQPRGVVAAITPWNFPLAIPTGMVSAPLVMGNGVVFKPAEQTPGMAWRLVEILTEAGLPPGVLAFLPGEGEVVGRRLVDHPDVSVVSFTGSKAVGLEIVERAAAQRPGQRFVKRVVAEMGGKNAAIVDADADLDVAVPAIISAAFSYGGQKCSACSRLIVLDDVFEATVERLVGAAEMVTVGHPRDPAVTVGPLIDDDAYERVERYRGLAAEEGEVVFSGGDVPAGGWFVGPTIVVAPAGCRVTTEEIFGPVLAVTRAADFEEALALANDTDYGLTAGIFSRSPSHIRRAAREVRAGNFYVNRSITGSIVGRQPFGGVGMSGVGSKAGGPDYLVQFAEPRVVTENTVRQGFAPLEA